MPGHAKDRRYFWDYRTRRRYFLPSASRGVWLQWRGEIGLLLAEVVRNWDAKTVSDRLELVLGSDLQYIRINGTVVGALVGCAIYLLSLATA